MKTLALAYTAVAAICLFAGVANAQGGVTINSSRTGTQTDVQVERTGLVFGASAKLRMDVDFLYRASTLLGEPVINCGVRVRKLSGTVSVPFNGKTHVVDIGINNSDKVRVYDLDLVAQYAVLGGFPVYLKCNVGVPAREGTEPFNVASSPQWGRTFCAGYRPDSKLPDRLGADWCAQGNGRFLEPDDARNVYRQVWAHEGAKISVAALSINANDLIVAETARLREAAEDQARRDAEAKAEADRLAAEAAAKEQELAAEAERKRTEEERLRAERQARTKSASDRVKAMLDRVTTDTAKAAQPASIPPATSDKDRIAAMAERVAKARAEQEAALAREAAARAEAEAARVAREREAAAQAARLAADAARKAEEERLAQERAKLTRFVLTTELRNACAKLAEYGGVGYRNAAGKCVAGPFRDGREFSQGFAVVESFDDRNKRFIDATGAFRFDAFRSASDFVDGFAAVSDGKTYFFIDRDGRKRPGDFTGAYRYGQGVAPVQRDKNGSWSFIDLAGRDAQLGQFDWAGPFDPRSKLAIVTRNSRSGAINRQGQMVIPATFYSLSRAQNENPNVHFSAAIGEARKTGNGSCSIEYFSTTHAYLDATGRQIGGTFEVKHQTGIGLCLYRQ
jgi:hypothetical protein